METAALAALIMSGLLSLASVLAMFILKHQSDSVRELQATCAQLEKSQAALAARAAETYLRREDCHRQSDAVLDRLDKIEGKLDRVIERIKEKA